MVTPRTSRGHFCLPVFFGVMHNGLSERATTRNLGCFGYLLSQISLKGLHGTFYLSNKTKEETELDWKAKDQR